MEKIKQQQLTMTWCDLPDDISKLIYDQLNWVDKVRFSSVCKSWNTIHHHLNTQPFLMSYNPSTTVCTFGGSPLDRIYHYSRRYRDDAIVIASKRAWLLLKHCKEPSLMCSNPFISERIILPSFDPGVNPKAIFSAPPTSPDCIIFVVRSSDVTNDYISINFCCSVDGDWSWKQCRFPNSRNLTSCNSLTYRNGVLYCFFDNGIVGILDWKYNHWTVVASPLLPIVQPASPFICFWVENKTLEIKTELIKFHIMECDGEILLMCTCRGFMPFFIFRLDKKKMDWDRITSLENRAIFLNDGLSSSFAILADAPDFRNKVFYFNHEIRGGCIWIYDLESRSHRISDLHPHITLGSKLVWIDPPL